MIIKSKNARLRKLKPDEYEISNSEYIVGGETPSTFAYTVSSNYINQPIKIEDSNKAIDASSKQMGTIVMGNALHYKASDITGKLLDKELVKVYAKGTVKDVAKGTVSEVGGLASDGVLLVGTRLENEERFKGREDLIEKANSMDTR